MVGNMIWFIRLFLNTLIDMELYNVNIENAISGDVLRITKANKRTIIKLISELGIIKEDTAKRIKKSKTRIKLKG